MGYKSYTTIQKWAHLNLHKKTRGLADLFNVDIDDLTNKDMEFPEPKEKTSRKGITINVLCRVAVGIPIEAIENVIDTEEIAEDMANTGSFFVLQIHGNSMEPKISEGDIVIVLQQDGIDLISSNPSYEPIFFSNEEIVKKPVKIIG